MQHQVSCVSLTFLDSTLPDTHPEYPTLGFFFGLMFKLTNLPLVTIALVEGCARAGGCDFTMAFDMRFGVRGRMRLSHLEACLGVYASGGGAMRMAQQMGKPRALEYLYSGRDIEASEGEKYGLINRAFDTSVEMHEFVDKYTARVSKFELTALAMTKKRVNDACNASSLEVFEKDCQAFMELLNLPKTIQLVGEVWEVIKGATDCEEERFLSDAIMDLPSYQ
jgi:enoyl-CoA hydratase/carnithine racemase